MSKRRRGVPSPSKSNNEQVEDEEDHLAQWQSRESHHNYHHHHHHHQTTEVMESSPTHQRNMTMQQEHHTKPAHINHYIETFNPSRTPVDLNASRHITIRLTSFMPEICHKQFCHVRMCFYLANPFVERDTVLVKHEIEMERQIAANGEIIYLIHVTADFPLIYDSSSNSNSSKPIGYIYYYYLEYPSKTGAIEYQQENNLVERRQTRYLDIVKYMQEHEVLKTVSFDKIDDFMLFGEENTYEGLKSKVLSFKSNYLKAMIPLDDLNNITTTFISRGSELIKKLHKVYDSLIMEDSYYKKFFEEIMAEVLFAKLKFINEAFHSRNSELTDDEYLSLLFIFYCSFSFDIGFLKNDMSLMTRLFSLHNVSKHNYFELDVSLFTNTTQISNMKNYLDMFLIFNQQNSHNESAGINALILLHYLLSKEKRMLYELSRKKPGKSVLIKYNLGASSKQENINILLNNYKSLFEANSSFLIGIFMNYFTASGSQENLDMFINAVHERIIPAKALIEYLNIKIESIKAKDRLANPTFSDASLNETFSKIFQYLTSPNAIIFNNDQSVITKKDEEIVNKNDFINSCINLLDSLVSGYSKELEAIIGIIKCICFFCFALNEEEKTKADKMNTQFRLMMESEPQERMRVLKEIIKKWLDKECDESLLVNNRLEARSQNEINNRNLYLRVLNIISDKIRRNDYNQKSTSNTDQLFLTNNRITGMTGLTGERPVKNDINQIAHLIEKDHNSINDLSELKFYQNMIMKNVSYFGIENEYEIYSNLLNMKLSTSNGLTEFQSEILKIFARRVQKRIDRSVSNFNEVIDFRINFDFRTNFKSFHKEITKIIDDLIIEMLEKSDLTFISLLCSNLSKQTEKNQRFLSFYIDKLLEKRWPEKPILELEFLLKWPAYYQILETQLNAEIKFESQPLKENRWMNKYNESIKSLGRYLDKVIDGEENVKTTLLLHNCLSSLNKLMSFLVHNGKISCKFNQTNMSLLEKLIELRKKEFDEFKLYTDNFKKFIQSYQSFKQIDFAHYSKLLDNYFNNVNGFNLNHLCRIIPFDKAGMIDYHDYVPYISYYTNIDKNKIMTIQKINGLNRKHCVLFDKILNSCCNEVVEWNQSDGPLSIDTFLSHVWPEALSLWETSLARKVESGQIKLVELDELLKENFKNEYTKMEEELIYINTYFKICDLEMRNNQIKLYNRFKASYKSAIAIDDIRKKLKLSNKFDELTDLLNINSSQYKKWNLNKMDQTLAKTIEILDKMNDERLECLEAFAQSLDLVQWLKNNTKDLNELKFLVDILVSSTTNIHDTNSKIRDSTVFAKTLKEAGTAFASLIYELRVTDEFYKFMELWEKCFSHLESDKKIAQKLMAIKDSAPYLDEIKKMKDNVEKNTLNKTKLLNKYSIYKIGFSFMYDEDKENSASSNIFSKFQNSLQISDIIQVEFDSQLAREENNVSANKILSQQLTKTLKFDELKELQNILMLMPDQQEKENTDAILYFNEMFIRVIRLAEIYLKLINNGCLFFENFIVHIYCDQSSSTIKTNSRPSLILSNKNNLFHSKSSKKMLENKKDSTLDSVNYLTKLMETTYQIWFKYISNLRETFGCLNYFTINQMKYLLLNLVDIIESNNENSYYFELTSAMLFNISEKISIQSLKEALRQSQIDLSSVNDSKSSYHFSTKSFEEKEIQYKDQEFYSNFKAIWNDFIENQNTIPSSTKSKHLTIKQLTVLLDVLDKNQKSSTPRQPRKVPGYLNKNGEPNLIFCSSKDQFKIVMSMYAHGDTATNPMPTNDEILYCTSTTTSEQVEIFLRIAFKSHGEKIYTMMNIQDLSYEQTSKIEQHLPYWQNEKTDNFILVFVCCNDKQSQSLLASLFIKNRITPIPLTEQNLEEYLFNKLINIDVENKIDPENNSLCLSSYDENNLSVRVLASDRSGNGKSLFVKKLCKEIGTKYEQETAFNYRIIRIKSSIVNIDAEIEKIIQFKISDEKQKRNHLPTIYHIDIAFEVFKNVDYYLFYLIVCCYLRHTDGLVWRRNKFKDIFLIEITPPYLNKSLRQRINKSLNLPLSRKICIHSMINYMPKLEFRTPKLYLEHLKNDINKTSNLKDNLFRHFYLRPNFQRVAYYSKKIIDYRRNHVAGSVGLSYTIGIDKSLEEKYDHESAVKFSEWETLDIILNSSELSDPSWHEIINYVTFLNSQLSLAENSAFFQRIEGFKTISIKLIYIMASDFGMPSMKLINKEEEQMDVDQNDFERQESEQANRVSITQFEIDEKRKWENMLHPYIIMNSDGDSVTFIGLYLSRDKKQFINPNKPDEFLAKQNPNIPEIPSELFINGFLRQRLPIFDNFNNFIRDKKLHVLSNLMNLRGVLLRDPDESYELTQDNCLKMIAIYLRFVCNIPVLVMGETGCGKTSLIKFFSKLFTDESLGKVLIHFKIHGGVTAKEIIQKLREAEELALQNYSLLRDSIQENNDPDVSKNFISSILFFDEANTTEEVGLIKEIMCDLTCNGRPIDFSHGLKIVAAVNPYKKHTPEMIRKLENAGLGFYQSAKETIDKFGQIPMRQLVYRVQPLPTSLMPLVWDFGQLNGSIENVYIRQMIQKASYANKFVLGGPNPVNLTSVVDNEDFEGVGERDKKSINENLDLLLKLLTDCQAFMRSRNDECSFVSIRDIDRVIKVTSWFLSKQHLIFNRMDGKKLENRDDSYLEIISRFKLNRAFSLALAVCYHGSLYSLETRKEFRKVVMKRLVEYYESMNIKTEENDKKEEKKSEETEEKLKKSESSKKAESKEKESTVRQKLNTEILDYNENDWYLTEILKCQNVFMDEINMDKKNIANNFALLENVFMMIVCIELRIPLFIVGKPGSSKSLAKSIVSKTMEGRNSKSNLFKNLKETYFVDFQCSPLTTSEMIVKAFNEASRFQKDNDLTKSVAVVNLDEIGLAEASESMPLKALHPLLEDGTDLDENTIQDYQKVSVIGISNWALDPAKMNRGIFVSRGEPDINELIESAKGICKYDKEIFDCIEPFIREIAQAYLDVCQLAREFKREFFGLRDYYSLIKMIYWFCSKDRIFTWNKLEHAVKRNFSGLEIDCLQPFKKLLYSKLDNQRYENDPGCGPIELLESALKSEYSESNSRYLLFLTENNSAIDIIQSYLINVIKIPVYNLTVIFGSSFRSDQEYSEVCRNISIIKHSMDIGKTVILLNSYNLYESLYDVLNQYYYEFGNQNYVNLGLGSGAHRVKCKVNDNFRLIVIAEKAAVYDAKKFPIPLINRLEKHFLNSATMLNDYQRMLVNEIEEWITKFCKASRPSDSHYSPESNEIFIGYHYDVVATLMLYIVENCLANDEKDLLLNINTTKDQKDIEEENEENKMSIQMEQQDVTIADSSINNEPLTKEKLSEKIIDLAKSYLLRCATPDSIIRVVNQSRQLEEEEKKYLWNEYFVIQKHLYLKELVFKHIENSAQVPALNEIDETNSNNKNLINKLNFHFNTNSNLIQITTHSKYTLVNTEIANLTSSFNNNGSENLRFNIDICQLESFDTQDQFSNKVRLFVENSMNIMQNYEKQNCYKNLLLIQSEFNQKNSSDLIACTRHTIVECFKERLVKSDKQEHLENIYIVLIINIPKEKVKSFVGFQLGYWSCYHLDEIEEPLDDLPSFETLYQKPLSKLLDESLQEHIKSYENGVNSEALKADKTRKFINLSSLLKKLARSACSEIVDTNLGRTMYRIGLIIKLCDNKKFISALVKRLYKLQYQKELEFMNSDSAFNWLIKDAASFKMINQYSTLRRACQTYIENKISPLLTYVLSQIDLYSNLDTLANSLASSDLEWKADLWLSLLENEDLFKLDYVNMRSKQEDISKELKQFNCQSDWFIKKFNDTFDAKKEFMPSLPFFWLFNNQLNALYINFIESNRAAKLETLNSNIEDNKNLLNGYAKLISSLFEQHHLFALLVSIIDKYKNKVNRDFNQILLDLYIKDFVLINCSINSTNDIEVISKIIGSLVGQLDTKFKSNIKYSLPIVNPTFEMIRQKVEVYLKFSMFDSNINKSVLFNSDDYFDLNNQSNASNCLQINFDSCLETIDMFRQGFQISSCFTKQTSSICSNNLHILLQLISLVLSGISIESSNEDASYALKLKSIKENYESLYVLSLFVDDILLKFVQSTPINEFTKQAKVFDEIVKNLNKDYFKDNVNFKTNETVELLHEFIIFAVSVLKNKQLSFKSEYFEAFYIDVIELLCFKNNQQLPNDDTIKNILDIIMKAKIKSKFGGDEFHLDLKTRSLLLQIVFRNYNEIVIKQLKKWFASSYVGNTSQDKLFNSSEEIALLFQNCIYDHFIYQTSELDLSKEVEFAFKLSEELMSKLASGSKKLIIRIFDDRKSLGKSFEVDFLLYISKIKYCLSVLAKIAQSDEKFSTIANKEQAYKFNENMKSLVISTMPHTNTLIYYLIKDMIRKYGSSSIKNAMVNEYFNWITPKDLVGANQNVTDKFVISGEKYLLCREAILTSFKEKNSNYFKELLERKEFARQDQNLLLPYISFAFYQNITLLYRNIDSLTNEIALIFEPILDHPACVDFKPFLKPLLENSFDHKLLVSKDNWDSIELAILLIQIKFSIIFSKSILLQPLKDLIMKPLSLKETFIPTMQQDTLYEIKTALRQHNQAESTRMYQCPNGHFYAIGNCGRAWEEGKCKECGEVIGGINHKTADNNIDIHDQLQDNTHRGYCLSDSSTTSEMTEDLRLLSQPAFHLERFFINACMYLACGSKDESVENVSEIMIYKPPGDLKQFFWNHMNKDLRLAKESLNLTQDEIIILLHTVCSEFLTKNYNSFITSSNSKTLVLEQKETRQQWEDLFYKNYLLNTLSNSSHILASSNELIKQHSSKEDENQSKIYFMAYELLIENEQKEFLYENLNFWKYRPIVSFESMRQDLQRNSQIKEHYLVLTKFSEMVNLLQLLNNLPEIIKLTKLFQKLFNKSIFKQNARNKTINQIIDSTNMPKGWTKEKIKYSISCLQSTFASLKYKLKDHLITKMVRIAKNVNLPNNMLHFEFNLDTNLVYFLPTLTSNGVIIYTLLHYLCYLQNEILTYYRETYDIKKIETKNADLFENKEYVISINKNTDLARIILSNFSYDARNLKFIFNYSNIEHQIIDKYLRTKPQINLDTISLFEYSDEITDTALFIKLEETVQQETIDLQLQLDILGNFKKINELSEALETLKIIINYSITTSADREESISVFIKKIFLDNKANSSEIALHTKIVENCKLKHLKNIWILLITKRSVLFTINGMDPFENLNDRFKVESNMSFKINFESQLLCSLTLVLYQVIAFVLSSDSSDLETFDNLAIKDVLSENSIESLNLMVPDNFYKLPLTFYDGFKEYDNETDHDDSTQAYARQSSIYQDETLEQHETQKMKHIYSLWKLVCNSWRGDFS